MPHVVVDADITHRSYSPHLCVAVYTARKHTGNAYAPMIPYAQQWWCPACLHLYPHYTCTIMEHSIERQGKCIHTS